MLVQKHSIVHVVFIPSISINKIMIQNMVALGSTGRILPLLVTPRPDLHLGRVGISMPQHCAHGRGKFAPAEPAPWRTQALQHGNPVFGKCAMKGLG
jgi:hypothetical protein